MRFLGVVRKIASGLGAAASIAVPVYLQELPKDFKKPDVGQKIYCKGEDKDSKGKVYDIFELSQPYEGVVVLEARKKHPYPFTDQKDIWSHATGAVTFSPVSPTFGKNSSDSIYYQTGNKVVGWNTKTKKSDITADDLVLYGSSVQQVSPCKPLQ